MPQSDHRRSSPTLRPAADGPKLVRSIADPVASRPGSDLQARLLPERYRMRENPFGMTPNPEYFYPTWTHREALSSLITGLECGAGFLSLIAPPGMGKTTLLFHLLERFRDEASTALLFNVAHTPQLLLRQLIRELDGAAAGDDAISLEEQLHAILLREFHAGRRCIVVVDEAQHLDFSVLEALRMVSNFETSHSKLLHIVLSGQPQLADKLADPQLAQLRQRISLIARLTPLGPEETAMYIAHRLQTGGYEGPALFTPAAMNAIWEHSEGIPRVINTVCFNALLLGGSFDVASIGDDIVREVIADLDVTLLNSPRARFAVPANGASAAMQSGHAAGGYTTQQDTALRVLAERALVAVGASGVGILVKEADGLLCRATSGTALCARGSQIDSLPEEMNRCLLTRLPVECASQSPPADSARCFPGSVTYIPVMDCGTAVAVLEASSPQEHGFTPIHILKLKAIADEISRTLTPVTSDPAVAVAQSGDEQTKCASEPTATLEDVQHAAGFSAHEETQPRRESFTTAVDLGPESLPAITGQTRVSEEHAGRGAAGRRVAISAGTLTLVAAMGFGIAWYAHALGRAPKRAELTPSPPHLEHITSRVAPAEVSETLRMVPALRPPQVAASHPTGNDRAARAGLIGGPIIAEPSRVIVPSRSVSNEPPAESVVPPPALGDASAAASDTTLSGVMQVAAITPNPPVSKGATPAEIVFREEPEYPSSARLLRLEGNVTLEAMITKDGRVRDVHAIAGPSLLVKAAQDAVEKWRYRPYTLNGKREDTKTRIVVRFMLPSR
jgi:TonB family protein